MNTHNLKVWPRFYRELVAGTKTFEMRKNDRDFQVGDTLVLDEWNDCTQEFCNSPTLKYAVVGILHGPVFGLMEGWCIMSLKSL